ncbi:MAG: NAD(P)H-dependent oxidoreductase [Saprospiraceae bacterium]|nr:NAD(P)H-dependent oxidoreductase [Saprospiraceae bacterium]MBK9631864.1 NAD(P)H-dependent oxidoreductase [Saprospiraceae bacterium]
MSFLIISGTNRPHSLSLKLANICKDIMGSQNLTVPAHGLNEFCPDLSNPAYFNSENWTKSMFDYQDQFIIPTEKFIMILPEYNGSFPGILKLWMDVLSLRQRDQCFSFKKLALIGISEGKHSNIRGLEHFSGVSRYFQMISFPKTVYLPEIQEVIENWSLTNPIGTRLQIFLDDFRKF